MTKPVAALLSCLTVTLVGALAAQDQQRVTSVAGSRPSNLPASTIPTPAGTGLILGRVVEGPGGQPIPGAVVTLNGSGINQRVMAEAEGRFVFRDLPRGVFSLIATKPGWSDGMYGRRRPNGSFQRLELVDGQQLADVAISLWRFGAISGTVRDEYGDPIAAIEVRALIKTFRTGDPRWTASVVTATDDRGIFRLDSLLPGEYTVVVPSTQASSPLTGVPSYVAAPVIADRQSITNPALSGSFRPSLDGAIVADGYLLSSGVPAAPGRERGQPFAYRTTFFPSALTSSEATSMTIHPGEERSGIDLDLTPVKTVAVSGVVSEAGQPAPNVSLELMRAAVQPSGRTGAISDIRVATTASDGTGRFVFPAVPSGQFVLRASKMDPTAASSGPNQPRQWAKMPIVVGEDDTVSLVVPLAEGFVVSGRLEFEGNTPLPTPERLTQTPVSVEALDPRDGVTRLGRVERDGRFSTIGVPSGDYVIRMPGTPPGWSLRSVSIAGRDLTDRSVQILGDISDVVVTFTDRPTELRGKVTGPGGLDSNASVIVFPGLGFPLTDLTWDSGSSRVRITRADNAGSYGFIGLPAGQYLLAAVPDDVTANWMDASFFIRLSSAATMVQLGEGEKRTQDLRTLPVQP